MIRCDRTIKRNKIVQYVKRDKLNLLKITNEKSREPVNKLW